MSTAFGDVLRRALRDSGRTQEELAEALQVTQSAVSAWLLGKRVPAVATKVFAIEEVLGLDPGELSVTLGYVPPTAQSIVSVEAAIRQDPDFGDEARHLLIEIVKSFRQSERVERSKERSGRSSDETKNSRRPLVLAPQSHEVTS